MLTRETEGEKKRDEKKRRKMKGKADATRDRGGGGGPTRSQWLMSSNALTPWIPVARRGGIRFLTAAAASSTSRASLPVESCSGITTQAIIEFYVEGGASGLQLLGFAPQAKSAAGDSGELAPSCYEYAHPKNPPQINAAWIPGAKEAFD